MLELRKACLESKSGLKLSFVIAVTFFHRDWDQTDVSAVSHQCYAADPAGRNFSFLDKAPKRFDAPFLVTLTSYHPQTTLHAEPQMGTVAGQNAVSRLNVDQTIHENTAPQRPLSLGTLTGGNRKIRTRGTFRAAPVVITAYYFVVYSVCVEALPL